MKPTVAQLKFSKSNIIQKYSEILKNSYPYDSLTRAKQTIDSIQQSFMFGDKSNWLKLNKQLKAACELLGIKNNEELREVLLKEHIKNG